MASVEGMEGSISRLLMDIQALNSPPATPRLGDIPAVARPLSRSAKQKSPAEQVTGQEPMSRISPLRQT